MEELRSLETTAHSYMSCRKELDQAKTSLADLPTELIENIGEYMEPSLLHSAIRTNQRMYSDLYTLMEVKWLRGSDEPDLHFRSSSVDPRVIEKYNKIIEVATNTINKRITDQDRSKILSLYCQSPLAKANPETLFNVANLIESDEEKESAAMSLSLLGCHSGIRQQCFNFQINFISGIKAEAKRINTIPEFWRYISKGMVAVDDASDEEIEEYLPKILGITDNLKNKAVIKQAAEKLAMLGDNAPHVQNVIDQRVNLLEGQDEFEE